MGFFENVGCIKTMDVSIEELKNPQGPLKRFNFSPGDIIVMSKHLMANLIVIKQQHIMNLYTGGIQDGIIGVETKELIDNYKFAENAPDMSSFICAFTSNGYDYSQIPVINSPDEVNPVVRPFRCVEDTDYCTRCDRCIFNNYDIFGNPKSIYSNMCRCMSSCEGKRFEFAD